MFTGPDGMFIFRQSTAMQAALYTSKLDTSKHLSSVTFIFFFFFFFASVFVSRSIASLSQLGISVHTPANSFHNMSLLLFGFSSNQPPAKKQHREKKGKQIWYMKKKTETERARLLDVSSQW